MQEFIRIGSRDDRDWTGYVQLTPKDVHVML